MLASYFFNRWSKKWRRTSKPRDGTFKRVLVLVLCGVLYLSLWSSWLYFNCSVIDQYDQEIKCKEAAIHFFNSPFWRDFQNVMKDIWNYYQHYGWTGIWKEIITNLDPQGESNAMKILELPDTASQEEITARYKKLARQWHPDRHKDPAEKAIAQDKFMEIQKAYEVLSKMKNQRLRRNQRERENPDKFTNRDPPPSSPPPIHQEL